MSQQSLSGSDSPEAVRYEKRGLSEGVPAGEAPGGSKASARPWRQDPGGEGKASRCCDCGICGNEGSEAAINCWLNDPGVHIYGKRKLKIEKLGMA